MLELDWFPIMEELAKENGIFCSEADFQFSLAQKLKEKYKDFQLWLEYPTDVGKKIYIDIFMTNGEYKYYIELKYKTKELQYKPYRGEIKAENAHTLANQAAQSIGALSYHQDIERLEKIVSRDSNNIGYAVFLTNDAVYYNKELQLKNIKKYSGCYFRDGKVEQTAKYPPNNQCELKKEYKCEWADYPYEKEEKTTASSKFKYIIAKISNQ